MKATMRNRRSEHWPTSEWMCVTRHLLSLNLPRTLQAKVVDFLERLLGVTCLSEELAEPGVDLGPLEGGVTLGGQRGLRGPLNGT
eukprot:6304451-Pyramimonas_sp.AAC.1